MIPVDRWISAKPPRPVTRPMLLQEWRDCAWVHWRYTPEVIRPHIPDGFKLDLADGAAWVSLVTFGIPAMRAAILPPIPGLRSGAESHLRTYVVDPEGRKGIWLLSLDIDPFPAAVIGRSFLLPYWPASIHIDRDEHTISYRVDRQAPGDAMVKMELDLEAGEIEADDLDRFLTARWILYSGIGRMTAAIFTEHPPWTYRGVTVRGLRQTMTARLGLPEPGVPLVHFSPGLAARLSWPHPMLLSESPPMRHASPVVRATGQTVPAEPPGDRMSPAKEDQEALVDEAIDASFPASDPPSYWGRST
jgi:uncharacterized protein